METQGIDIRDRQPHVCEDVSPWPIYLGQPPPHASRRRTIHGGSLARVRAWNRPLQVEEINDVAMDPPPEAVRAVDGGKEAAKKKAAAAQVLALAHGCCQMDFGRKEFSTVATVRALLSMVLVGEPEMRRWALRVCRETLPWQEPGVVDDQFRCNCFLSANFFNSTTNGKVYVVRHLRFLEWVLRWYVGPNHP